MKAERLVQNSESLETMDEEEKAAKSWEKRVAFVLCNHENGSIFKAFEECLKSNSLEMAKSCLALASVALRSFIDDKVALKELGVYAKSVCKSLRKLKRSSVLVTDILKALMNLSSINATELWPCAEVTEIDSGCNGEVLSFVHLKGRVYSSHSDGTIKVWDAGKRVLRLIQEAREHTKAVTCLSVPSSGDKLYSGSLDKTIREVDMIKCTSSTFFSGTKKLLGKQIIHTLCIRDGFLFAGGSSVDGIAGR
ncbi:Ring-type e3 ubiquitin transferase, partial [Thalictrum thalictroides]